MTFLEAAIEVLRREGKPLHFKELTRLAIKYDLLSVVGRDPEQMMQTRLQAEVRRSTSDLERTSPGVFSLRGQPARAARGENSKPPREPAAAPAAAPADGSAAAIEPAAPAAAAHAEPSSARSDGRRRQRGAGKAAAKPHAAEPHAAAKSAEHAAKPHEHAAKPHEHAAKPHEHAAAKPHEHATAKPHEPATAKPHAAEAPAPAKPAAAAPTDAPSSGPKESGDRDRGRRRRRGDRRGPADAAPAPAEIAAAPAAPHAVSASPDTQKNSPHAVSASPDTQKNSPHAVSASPDTQKNSPHAVSASPDTHKAAPHAHSAAPHAHSAAPHAPAAEAPSPAPSSVSPVALATPPAPSTTTPAPSAPPSGAPPSRPPVAPVEPKVSEPKVEPKVAPVTPPSPASSASPIPAAASTASPTPPPAPAAGPPPHPHRHEGPRHRPGYGGPPPGFGTQSGEARSGSTPVPHGTPLTPFNSTSGPVAMVPAPPSSQISPILGPPLPSGSVPPPSRPNVPSGPSGPQPPAGDASTGPRLMTLADAAYDVLRGSSDGRPIHYRQIAEIAIKRRLVRGELADVSRALRAALVREQRQRDCDGLRPRMRNLGQGLFALGERKLEPDLYSAERDLLDRLNRTREATRVALRRRLRTMPAGPFELLMRLLLERIGMIGAELVKRGEGVAYYGGPCSRGSRNPKLLVAIRPGEAEISREAIGELRAGVRLRGYDEGLILCAGRLSAAAMTEANAAAPLEVYDQDALTDLLLRHQLGVRRMLIPVDYVDTDLFNELLDQT